MRNRFFFIILFTLIFAAVGINLVHVRFFRSQRLKLIDTQIADSSNVLMTSEEFASVVKKPELIEDTISRVLQGARIGKVFILRDESGQILYQSFNVGLLKADLPIRPEWVAVNTTAEYVRVRNTSLPGTGLVLQVGLVLDRNFVDWEIVDTRVINYVSGIVLAVFLASVLLTLVLLSPLRLLIAHLRETTSDLVNLKDVRPLPLRLTRFTHGFWARSDEFAGLLSTVQKLIDRINLNYKLTRSWTLQMAHELKTPLAIVRAETEAKEKLKQLPPGYSADVFKEIEQMSEIISQFLDWAELENSQLQRDLHALRMRSVVTSVSSRIEKIWPGRLNLRLQADFPVFANPIHLDQLITNLVTNALKFSPANRPVEIDVLPATLVVRDHGPGLPKEVRERLGEPFNVGPSPVAGKHGNGLGLAWIATVTKLYQWEFEIHPGQTGTEAVIRFPVESVN